MFCRIVLSLSLLVASVFASGSCCAQAPERFCGRVIPLAEAGQAGEIGAVADLDSDGDVDYVFVTGNSNNINVYINDGFGNGMFFGDVVDVGLVTDDLTNLVVADLDGDLDLDIAVGNGTRSEISVFLNAGAGSFSDASVSVPTFSQLKYFEIADVDRDSDLDFVCLTETGLRVFLNTGLANFFPFSTVALEDEPTVLSIGDINGDSHVDVVTGAPGAASVFQNNGSGFFELVSAFSFAGPSESLKLFDQDGDSDLDLVIGNHNSSNVAIYSNEKGVLSFEQEYFAGFQIHQQIETGDINNDSQVDLVFRGSLEVFASYADGDGGFYDAIPIASQQVQFIAVEDVDGDSDLDVISDVATFVNEGVGRFGDPIIYFPSDEEADGVSAVITADIDGDGDQDLVYSQVENRIGVRRNNGLGEFGVEEVYLTQEVVRALVIEDFNGDGANDLAYVAGSFDNKLGSHLQVRFNTGDGTFNLVGTYPLPTFPHDLVASRLVGNSTDLVVSTWDGVIVFRNLGFGFFTPGFTREANTRCIAAGDVTGDGVNDILVGQNNGFAVLTNTGNANFSDDFYGASNVREIEIADLDNDGDLDVGIAGAPDTDHASIYLNDGSGVFTLSSFVPMGNDVQQISLVDVNEDSIPDLAANSRELFGIRLGLGDGSFGEITQYLARGDFDFADLNNDDLVDFVFANTGCQLLFNGCFNNTFTPSSWTVFRGQIVEGAFEDIFNSDDSRVGLIPGFTINASEAPIWVILDGVLENSFSSLALSIEAHASSPNLERTIEVWNWETESYDVVDVSNEAFPSDMVVDVDVSSPDFVQPDTGATQARIGWRVAGFVISLPWQIDIDLFRWSTR